MSNILLIDAYSQIFRMFYAIRMLNDATGTPANARYGMAKLFLQLHENYPSDYAAMVFDLGKCRRRCALLPQYKAQRPPMPEELRSQIAPIRDMAEAFGFPCRQNEGFEADDIICGITHHRGDFNNHVLILTSDKDIAQLTADNNVRILNRGKDKSPWNEDGADAVLAKYGVHPEQLCDYLALLGDTADNIPGIPGCGPKTASKLLADYGSITGIYTHIDEIKSETLRESLRNHRERLALNQQLISLDDALPENWNGLECIRRTAPDWKRIAAIFQASGFKSLMPAIEPNLQKKPEQPLLF